MVAYDDATHVYRERETGRVLPHVTELLERAGWKGSIWYTEEGRVRGRAVHRMTADYDLGALDPTRLRSKYKPYVLAHVAAMAVIRPEWSHVETIMARLDLGFAGRPDRVGLVWGAIAVVDEKTGAKEKSHGIQTALQAILAEPETHLLAESVKRYGLYVTGKGRWNLEPFEDGADVREARRIVQCYIG